MQAVILERFGPPQVLQYQSVPTPRPGPGEVLMAVRAVSVNRSLDLRVRANGDGRHPQLPLVLGTDPTGIVAQVGEDVSGYTEGDRIGVYGPIRCGQCPPCLRGHSEDCERSQHLGVHRWGGYAEYVTVPAASLVKLPEALGFADATVILRHYPTAFFLLAEKGGLKAGEHVLIMGAAGALGSAGVQVARLLGAEVVAGAGSDARVQAALANGAHFGVNYRSQNLAERVMELTHGNGVELVFENIGDPVLWPQAFASLRANGRLVTAGAHGGGTVPLDVRRLYQRRITVMGGAGASRWALEQALAAARQGLLHPVIDRILPLSQAADAHAWVESGAGVGKVILDPTLD